MIGRGTAVKLAWNRTSRLPGFRLSCVKALEVLECLAAHVLDKEVQSQLWGPVRVQAAGIRVCHLVIHRGGDRFLEVNGIRG